MIIPLIKILTSLSCIKVTVVLETKPSLLIITLFIHNHPYPTYNLVSELRTKFNATLELEAKKSCYALTLPPPDFSEDLKAFDTFGNLTFYGKKQFWRYIDTRIKCHDRNEDVLSTQFAPKPHQNCQITYNRSNGRSTNRTWTSLTNHTQMDDNIWGQAAIMSQLQCKRSDKQRKKQSFY